MQEEEFDCTWIETMREKSEHNYRMFFHNMLNKRAIDLYMARTTAHPFWEEQEYMYKMAVVDRTVNTTRGEEAGKTFQCWINGSPWRSVYANPGIQYIIPRCDTARGVWPNDVLSNVFHQATFKIGGRPIFEVRGDMNALLCNEILFPTCCGAFLKWTLNVHAALHLVGFGNLAINNILRIVWLDK